MRTFALMWQPLPLFATFAFWWTPLPPSPLSAKLITEWPPTVYFRVVAKYFGSPLLGGYVVRYHKIVSIVFDFFFCNSNNQIMSLKFLNIMTNGVVLISLLLTYFTPYSSVFIVNFEHVIACWEVAVSMNWLLLLLVLYLMLTFPNFTGQLMSTIQ